MSTHNPGRANDRYNAISTRAQEEARLGQTVDIPKEQYELAMHRQWRDASVEEFTEWYQETQGKPVELPAEDEGAEVNVYGAKAEVRPLPAGVRLPWVATVLQNPEDLSDRVEKELFDRRRR